MIVMGWIDPIEWVQLAGSDLPTVVFDCAPPAGNLSFDVVTHANEEGMRQAVSSLIELGHRDIACLVHATSNDPTSAIIGSIAAERRRGHERAWSSRNLPLRPELIVPVVPSCSAAYSAAQQMMRHIAPAPTAI